jgi:hypothetical protein
MVESVRQPEPTTQERQDFSDRWKLWSSSLTDSHNQGISAASGREVKAKDGSKPNELSQAERAKLAWEKLFGKRGDPKTESAIEQTVDIFKQRMTATADKKAKAEAAKKKQRRGRRR